MTPEMIVELARNTVQTAVLLSLPLLGIALAVTILMSIIQVVTSMQENTISTVPRLLAVGVAAVMLAPWMLQRLSWFTHQVFEDMARFAK